MTGEQQNPEHTASGWRAIIDTKAIVSGLIGAVLLAMLSALLGIGPGIRLPWMRSRIAPVDVGSFLPRDWRVVSRQELHLDGTRSPQEALHITGVPDTSTGLTPGNIILVAWDGEAKRWTKVFDAQSSVSSYPEPDQAILDSHLEPSAVKMIAVRRGDGKHDFAFSANMVAGAGTGLQVVAVVRFDRDIARLVYTSRSAGTGTIERVDDGRTDRLRVESSFYTGVDPLLYG